MRVLGSAVLVFTLCLVAASAEEEDPVHVDPAHVDLVNGSYVMNKHNFDYIMKTEDFFIVYAWVEWCGHCKEFSPTWAELAEKINKSPDFKTKAFSANITENPHIHNEWNTVSFPTIYYVRKGVHETYHRHRGIEELTEYIEKNQQDQVIPVSSEDLEEAIEAADVAVVGEFSSAEAAAMFEKIAWQVKSGSTFYQIEDSQEDKITVYSQHPSKPYNRTITDISNETSITEAIKHYRRPLVIPFSRENHHLAFEVPNISLSVLLFHEHDAEHAARLAEFTNAARTYSRDMTFVEMRMDSDYVQAFTKFFKLKAEDAPVVVIISTAKGDEGKMSKSQVITERGIAQLIEDWQAGSAEAIEPDTEQPGEEAWTSEKVICLTDEDYADVVGEDDSTTIVMWYKPTCPHCVKAREMWEELAAKYEDHPYLQVAQIKSSHAKKFPELGLKKVPSIYLYRGEEEKIEWEGKKLSLEEIDGFLMDNFFNVADVKKDEL